MTTLKNCLAVFGIIVCLLMMIVERPLLAQGAGQETCQLWHTHTVRFEGPQTSEQAELNPFTNVELDVVFTHEGSGQQFNVRGFYAADGNAGETSADSGNIWKVHFCPNQIGKWNYSAKMKLGVITAGIQDFALDNSTGSFEVTASKADENDFRAKGKLGIDGHYFRLSNGKRWLKGGTNSPENFLAFADFDGTYRISAATRDGESKATTEIHSYTPHLKDWNEGDPVWQNSKGKGIIGAVNYMAASGMNSIYFLTLNINGDGKDVWPYADPKDFSRFDCSKLDQWDVVFQHMQRQGILIHVVTQETENEKLLDGGDVGPQRSLYYRELIARFAHHPGLIWNLGEENGPTEWSPIGQDSTQQKAMASFLKANDPYKHPVLIHTHSSIKEKDDLLPPLLGHQPLDGLSFQINLREQVHSEIIKWHQKSDQAGQPWLITMDEIGEWHTGVLPDAEDPNHDTIRRFALWGSLMAGGAGVEWYFGAKHDANDLTSEDWRKRKRIWELTRFAMKFFEQHLPYWEMQPADELTTSKEDYCFAKPGEIYAVYLPANGLTVNERDVADIKLNLTDCVGKFSIQWFDPLRGGELQDGNLRSVDGGSQVALGLPPGDVDQDWVILVRKVK